MARHRIHRPAYQVRVAGTLLLAGMLMARPAKATSAYDDPYDLPDAPRSIALPELTHPDIEWTSVSSIGGVARNEPGTGGEHSTPVMTERFATEIPIAARRWFVGAEYDMALGAPLRIGGPAQLVGGNFELYGRTVWATRTGLAFGGGLGVLPSVATFHRDGPGGDVALAAAALQPTDYAFFHQGVLTVRAFVDVRDLWGDFVIQFRQSFDWSAQVSDPGDSGVSAASTLYVGYRVMPSLGIGLEGSEYYFVDDVVPDRRRAHFVVAPSVRLLSNLVQPAISAFTSVGYPLYPGSETVWGLRFAFTFVWEPWRR